MNKRIYTITIYSDYPGRTLVEFDRHDGHYRLRKVRSHARADMLTCLINSPKYQFSEAVIEKGGYITLRFVPVDKASTTITGA